MKRTLFFKIIIFSISFIILCTALIAVPNVSVLLSSNQSVLVSSELGESKYDCILVLGAGLRHDKTPSNMLADRLSVAIELYDKGYSEIIVLSGDSSPEEDYDEVAAMKIYCLDRGVREEDIVCDNFGFSTYESLYNISEAKRYEKIIVVTQEYHLYRALYIAKRLGLEAYGVSADIREYGGQNFRDIREIFARAKDFYKSIF